MLASKRFPAPFPQRPIVVPLPRANGVIEKNKDVREKCEESDVRRLLKELKECL
jgi:hypothetical protein